MGKIVERPVNKWGWFSREPRAEYLDEINSLSQVLKPLTAGDVIVRGMRIMNDRPMHESYSFVRKFDADAVKQAKPFVRGKPVLANHTTSGVDGLPLGRFFRAENTVEEGTQWLDALFFMLNDEQGKRIASAIDGGIISENSPTLEFDRVYCSICDKDDMRCDHIQGNLYEGHRCYAVMTDIVDFWEGSLVWAGQQKNTSQFIPAGRDVSDLSLDEYMAGVRREDRDALDNIRAGMESAEQKRWESFWWK